MNPLDKSFVEYYRFNDILIKPLEEQIKHSLALFESGKTTKITVSINALNYAIIHDIQDVAAFIIKHYQDLRKSFHAKAFPLNNQRRFGKLAPIHVAAMLSRNEILIKLISAGVDVNSRDYRKWTPLHHSAMRGNVVGIMHLLGANADAAMLTDTNGTYEDIIRQTNSEPQEALIPLWIEKNEKELSQLTAKEFHNLTNAKYRNECLFTRFRMAKDWTEVKLAYSTKDVVEAYTLVKAKPPKLILKRVLTDSQGKELASSPGLGIYAAEKILPGKLVGEYTGLMPTVMKEGSYAINMEMGLNAEFFGNAMSRINDGFPNVQFMAIDGVKGLAQRVCVIALDVINTISEN